MPNPHDNPKFEDLNVRFANPLQINISLTIMQDPGSQGVLNQILQLVTQHTQTLKEIKMTDAEVLVLLGKVDATTNGIATNLDLVAAKQQEMADTDQEISDDIDALIAASGGGLSAEASAKLQEIADKLQANSDKADSVATVTSAQAAFLKTVAAKNNPVVPPPPPPPPLP